MNKAYLFILTIVFSIVFTNCNKNKYCYIKINTPTDNQTFDSGALITIDATIYDDGDAIMGERLIVTSIPANDTIINFAEDKFTFEYLINKSFTGSTNTQYKIEIKAYGGHGNWASKSVNITCN
ncbi:MAG: hypothetical protein QM802_07255 [Agriterribacter sp.]